MHIVVRCRQIECALSTKVVLERGEQPGQAELMKYEMLAPCMAAVLASCSTDSQTGGEGCFDCVGPDLQEISVQTARDLGYPVDLDLAMFDSQMKVPFHRSDQPCTDAGPISAGGSILFHAQVQKLQIVRSNPQYALFYRVLMDLETDDGSFVALGFDGQGYSAGAAWPSGSDGSSAFVSLPLDARNCTGSLRLWMDPNHTTAASARVSVYRGPAGISGNVFLLSSTGSLGDASTGDGLFWPVLPADVVGRPLKGRCAWPEPWSPPDPQSQLMSLDEYNRF
jgi:hypothetical protein